MLRGHDDDVPLRIPRIAASTLYSIVIFGLDGRCYECDGILHLAVRRRQLHSRWRRYDCVGIIRRWHVVEKGEGKQ